MNGTVLIATAYFFTETGHTTENHWGDLSPAYMPKVRQWFDELVSGQRELVGAYLYVRAGVFSDNPAYHKPTKYTWLKASHVHRGI